MPTICWQLYRLGAREIIQRSLDVLSVQGKLKGLVRDIDLKSVINVTVIKICTGCSEYKKE